MKTIKKVEFIFENCEHFSIDANYFGDFCIENIHENIYRCGLNAIGKFIVADTVVFEIYSEADTLYNCFGEDRNKFDRIKSYMDITSLELVYDDGSIETIYVDYEDSIEGQLGTSNTNQKVYKSELGNLYIVIAKDEDIEDFFNKEDINDREFVDYYKAIIIG